MTTDIQNKLTEARLISITEIATDYTSMIRILQKGSKRLISKKLYNYFKELNTWDSELIYKTKHKEFCEWFINNIQLGKKGGCPSYGHAAKVFDITTKVIVYFCNLPSTSQAGKIMQWLNAAIDNQILKNLQNDFNGKYDKLNSITLDNIGKIGKDEYEMLQLLIREKAKEEGILPVEWEELIFRRLNRK